MAAGIEDIETLAAILKRETKNDKNIGPYTSIYTRNTPKRAAELLDGGSVYSVFRSIIQCRRKILDIRQAKDSDGAQYCKILLEPKLIRVIPVAQKPFQGWRYLEPARAPRDSGVYKGIDNDNAPPAEMAEELRSMGLL